MHLEWYFIEGAKSRLLLVKGAPLIELKSPPPLSLSNESITAEVAELLQTRP